MGPPAVGKMTVGTELAARTGFKLFHNHQTIDLALGFFPFGSPPFARLVGQVRRLVLQEVASSDLAGLIFTFAWAFDDPSGDAIVEEFSSIFRDKGGRAYIVELEAPQEVRLQRNETAFRLAMKPFKRDVDESRRQLLLADSRRQYSSYGKLDGREGYLRIDNTNVPAAEVAGRVIARFALPVASEARGAD